MELKQGASNLILHSALCIYKSSENEMSFQNRSSFTTSLPCPKDRSEGKRRQEELPHTFTVHNYSIVVVNIHKKSIKKLGGHKGAVAKNEAQQNKTSDCEMFTVSARQTSLLNPVLHCYALLY